MTQRRKKGGRYTAPKRKLTPPPLASEPECDASHPCAGHDPIGPDETPVILQGPPIDGVHKFDACALCFEAPGTIREHVPPESIGGVPRTWTCEPCNRGLGKLEQRLPRVLGRKTQVIVESAAATERVFGYEPPHDQVGGKDLAGPITLLWIPKSTVKTPGLFDGPVGAWLPDNTDVSVNWALLKHAVLAATLAAPDWARSSAYLTRARRLLRELGEAALQGDRSPKPPLEVWWCSTGQYPASMLTVGNEHLPSGHVRPVAMIGQYVVSFPVLPQPDGLAPPAMPPCLGAEVDLGRAQREFGGFP